MKKVIVIGGGAAGFFAAANILSSSSNWEVIILEKSSKLLSKVRISGGGRCNVSHACFDNSLLVENFPRGKKELLGAFSRFNTSDTVKWFEARGVKLKTENDGRIFPVSNNSLSIVNCLQNEVSRLGGWIKLNAQVTSIQNIENEFIIELKDGERLKADKIIIATGGSPKIEGYDYFKAFQIETIPPVPSLFTFNVPHSPVTKLMGISIASGKVKIKNTKLQETGSLLITHWGFSGPVILRLSAWGARILSDMNYHFDIEISWVGDKIQDEVEKAFTEHMALAKNQLVHSHSLFGLPSRLWKFLLEKIELPNDIKWAMLSKKQKHNLTEVLLRDTYQVKGKTTFKEEFVTCGGVSLNEVNFKTMESRKCPGLYFAGEILNIDGITGGFNFQNAWTTAWIAACAIKGDDS